jgi:hypothetical protein
VLAPDVEQQLSLLLRELTSAPLVGADLGPERVEAALLERVVPAL